MASSQHHLLSLSSSHSSPKLSLQSSFDDGSLFKDILNMSLENISSHHSTQVPVNSHEVTLSCGNSEEFGCSDMADIPSSHSSEAKGCSSEIVKEIAFLEMEISHLERYLLSLYRTAFEQYLSHSLDSLRVGQRQKNLLCPEVSHSDRCDSLEQRAETSLTDVWSDVKFIAPPKARATWKHTEHGRCSLADHLGVSIYNDISATPDRLSEDIVRCISCLYWKLADQPLSHGDLLASPLSSSLCSGSTCYDHNAPDLHYEQAANEDIGPYARIIQVVHISLDDHQGFGDTELILQSFRSMVQSLETVDPRMMKREEKLAFWINIHNAMVMHAYLAYGTLGRVKNSSVLKAAYNIGGHSVNPYVIQSSILGIRSHYPSSWLQTLFSPTKKMKKESPKHIYAIEYPEPLVRFGLCSGAYSDPSVRVYRARNIFRDLRAAQEEYIRANVYVHKETKVFLPKILSYFASDMSFSRPELLESINGCLSEVQQRVMRRCLSKGFDRCIYWSPHNSSFRYIIHI